MKNDLIFIGAILAVFLGILSVVVWNRYSSFNEAFEKCINADGQPITERGVYKFCMKKDSVLEVK